MERCETCRYFEAKAVLDVVHICHNPDLHVDTLEGTTYYSFQPPSGDFGCTLWVALAPTPEPQP